MDQNKYFYIIIGLLLVAIVLLLVIVLTEQGKPVTGLLNKAGGNIEDCNKAVADWRQKYPSGTTVSDTARDELSLILDVCMSKVGENE